MRCPDVMSEQCSWVLTLLCPPVSLAYLPPLCSSSPCWTHTDHFLYEHFTEEKAKIQKDLAILTERLSKINESLQRKQQARSEYDQTIQETEAAYMKILESSQTLLHVLKRESVNLVKKQSSSH